jgi:hypothetical protein
VLEVVTTQGLDIGAVLQGNRWVRPNYESDAETLEAPPLLTAVVLSKGNKLSQARTATADLLEALLSLGSDEFQKQLKVVRQLTDTITKFGSAEVSNKQACTRTASNHILPTVRRNRPSGETGNGPDVANNIPSTSSRRKSPIMVSSDPMQGLDQTFLMQDESYYLQQVKVRNFRVRTLRKNRNRSFMGNGKRHWDQNSCAVCMQQEPADSSAEVIDWVSCDGCKAWFHNVCCNYACGSTSFLCPLCGVRSDVGD